MNVQSTIFQYEEICYCCNIFYKTDIVYNNGSQSGSMIHFGSMISIVRLYFDLKRKILTYKLKTLTFLTLRRSEVQRLLLVRHRVASYTDNVVHISQLFILRLLMRDPMSMRICFRFRFEKKARVSLIEYWELSIYLICGVSA